MKRTAIETREAPAAIGPYSQAIVVGNLVFCSGQVALDPKSGELVGASDVRAQTHRVLENIKAVLAAAGTGLEHAVKTTIFLVDLADFGTVNEIYGRFLPSPPPARSTVQVAALPRGALVEIEVIAVLPAST